ncbi:MAG: FAD-dependent oxidoreductase [bacterium]|nr:FAD-dependent oxidoreductase [bacterium]
MPFDLSQGKQKVTILGAGLAGLAAGYELVQKNIPVEIIEAESAVGGLASSIHYNGYTFDLGPHRIYSEYPEIIQFLKDLCGDELITVDRHSRIRLHNRYYQYPLQAGELMRYLSLFLPVKFLTSYFLTRIKNWVTVPDELSYAGWITNRFGKAMYQFFFEPYAQKVWGVSPGELSSEIAKKRLAQENLLATIRDVFRGHKQEQVKTAVPSFLYPKTGIGTIAEKLAESIRKQNGRILLNEQVVGFQKTNGKINQVILENKQNNSRQEVAVDSLVSTLPLSDLIPMLTEEPKLLTISSSLKFQNIVLLYVMLKKAQVTSDTWLYFPEKQYPFTRIYEPKNFSAQLCPEGKSSLVIEVTCSPSDSIWSTSDAEFYANLIPHLKQVELVANEDEVEEYLVVRIPNAYPIYDLAYQIKITKLFEFLSGVSNLITTGRQGLFHHNNLDHSLIMGTTAAKYILANPAQSKSWYQELYQFDKFRVLD